MLHIINRITRCLFKNYSKVHITIDETETSSQKKYTVKNVSYAHTKYQCEEIIQHMHNIELICKIKNIEFVRDKLNNINPKILKKYVEIYNIFKTIYYECAEYYDTHISHITDRKKRNIELIIAFLCILPYNEEIKTSRNTDEIKKEKKVQFFDEPEIFSSKQFNIFLTPEGITYGIKLF